MKLFGVCWICFSIYLPIDLWKWEDLQFSLGIEMLHSDGSWRKELLTILSMLTLIIFLYTVFNKTLGKNWKEKMADYTCEIVILLLGCIWFQYGWDKVHLLQFPPPHPNWALVSETDNKLLFWQWMGEHTLLQIGVGYTELGLACVIVTLRKSIVHCLAIAASAFLVILNVSLGIGVLSMAIYLLLGHVWLLKRKSWIFE